MKTVIIILVLISVFSTYVSGQLCNKAVIDSPNDVGVPAYEIICGAADGFCPENYGDWSICTANAYGGKCTPCDIDCPSGANGCNLEINFQEYIKPSSIITITGAARDIIGQGDLELQDSVGAKLLDDNGGFVIRTCTTYPCSITDTEPASSTGGTQYTYKAQFISGPSSGNVEKTGRTTPLVTITDFKRKIAGQGNPEFPRDPQDPPGCQGTECKIKARGVIQAYTDSSSELGISRVDLFLEKKDDLTGQYNPVFASGALTCAPCNPDPAVDGPNCNNIGTFNPTGLPTSYTYIFEWDSTICDNEDFRIISKAVDTRPETSGGLGDSQYFEFKLDNPQPPVIPEATRLLNLIFIKVRTWILT